MLSDLKILVSSLLLFIPAALHAQNYIFNNYGVEEGLPQSNVYAIVQDQKGYIWLGTESGVARFDGKSFDIFSTEEGLSEVSVTAICQDKTGKMWLGHINGGISIIDDNKIIKVKLPENISINRIFTIYMDHEGSIWLTTIGSGAIKITDATDDLQDLNNVKVITREDGLSNNVFDMLQDKNGIFWFITSDGIISYNEKENQFDFFSPTGMLNYQATSILEDRKGDLWFGTYHGGLIQYITKDREVRYYTTYEGLSNNWVTTLAEDRRGNILIGTWTGGVSIFYGSSFENLSINEGLSSNKIRSIFEDREGNIWFGTQGGGASYYKGKRFLTYTEDDGLVDEHVSSINQDSEGNLWFGTDKGITIFDPRETNKSKAFKTFDKLDITGYKQVMSITEDLKGNIWIGTWGGGVAKYNLATSRITSYKVINTLVGNQVFDIAIDQKGDVWVATNQGISLYLPEKNIFKTYTTEDGLSGNEVATIFCDSEDNLWFGTRGGWLTFYDRKTFTTFDQDGLKHSSPTSLAEDKDGNIWIGTEGGGAYKYEPTSKSFTHYSQQDGLLSDYITLTIADNHNNVWFGTNRGLNKFVNKEKKFFSYGKAEGFSGIEAKHNAAYKDAAGNLWFGTIKGVSKYDADVDFVNLTEPLTHIGRLRIKLRDTLLVPDLRLKHSQNHITLDFIGICFSNSQKVRYTYMLENFDEDWVDPTDQNFATYTNLSPGTYTFHVKASNNNNIWNKEATSYTFTITPPFWRETWFYILCIILAWGSIYAFIKCCKSFSVIESKPSASGAKPQVVFAVTEDCGYFVAA